MTMQEWGELARDVALPVGVLIGFFMCGVSVFVERLKARLRARHIASSPSRIVVAPNEVASGWFDGVPFKPSGERQLFFAANRNFDDQLYFMQLVAAQRYIPPRAATAPIELGQLKPTGKGMEPVPDISDMFADRVLQDYRKDLARAAQKDNA